MKRQSRRYFLIILIIMVGVIGIFSSYIFHRASSSLPNQHIIATGMVQGVVTSGPGSPLGAFCSQNVPNVSIIFIDSHGTTYTTITNTVGAYTMHLPTGSYAVRYGRGNGMVVMDFHDKGKGSGVTDVVVRSGQTTIFNGCFDTGLR